MDSTDLQVLRIAIEWLESERRVVLATVARTWGSSPRPVGAWAAVRDDGAIAGSVSGGCVEADLVELVRSGQIDGGKPRVLSYGVTSEEASRFGLPCGGTLQLVVEPAPELEPLRSLAQRIADRSPTARTLDVSTGRVALEAAAPAQFAWDGTRLTTVHGPPLRLLIIGAGQLSAYLASMAQQLDYAVTVCDSRDEYHAAWQVSGARVIREMPDDAVLAFKPDPRTAIVALTHDPKLDDMALLEALRSDAFYVGALGSRVNTANRKHRLQQHFGLSDAELARLHGPVGLPIGSRTLPEIAVSIIAEMTAVKNRAPLAKLAAESRERASATTICA